MSGSGESVALFPGIWSPQSNPPRHASIRTPLGEIRFHAHLENLEQHAPHWFRARDLRKSLIVWVTPRLRAELLICPIEPLLPPGMTVDGCVAAVWRVRANETVTPFMFECQWLGSTAHKHGPCSGQGIEAQEWTDGRLNVTVATPDAESILEYPVTGGVLPASWLDYLHSAELGDAALVEYLPEGFRLRTPGLKRDETCHVQYVVAWGNESEENIGPWFAVDQTPNFILSGP